MRRILNMLVAAFFLSCLGTSFAQDVLNVSVDSNAGSDSISVQLSEPADPKIFFLKEPDRIVIDFNGAVFKSGKQQLELKSENISSIRWAQNTTDPYNFRIAAELKRDIAKKVVSSDGGRKILIIISSSASAPLFFSTMEGFSGKKIEVPISQQEPPREEQISESRFNKEIVPVVAPKLPQLAKLKKFSVVVNGNKLKLGRRPVFVKGRLMVPAKSFFDPFGYTSLYESRTKTVTFRLSDEVEARIKEGSAVMTVNGYDRAMISKAARIGRDLYIPLLSAVKWLGLKGYWSKTGATLYIAPRITKISWDEVSGAKAVVIDASSGIGTFEAELKEKLKVYAVKIPNFILDIESNKISVKEEGIKGIKAIQDGGTAKIGIYLDEEQSIKPVLDGSRLVVNFPPSINSVRFTDEGSSIKIEVNSTKPVYFDVKRLYEPDRIILDIPNALYNADKFKEINKGGILRIRASQFKSEPLASRIVIDLNKDIEYDTLISDDQRYCAIVIRKQKVEAPKPKKLKILKGRVIIIDPGHGGNDPGAFGISGDRVKEKHINLATSLKLAKLLSDAGAIPLLTREDDTFISLQDRVEFAKNNKADLLVSVHYNSSEKGGISGTETYYYNPNSKLLGDVVHRNMVFNLKRTDRGLQRVKFYVIYNSPIPSILVEPLYLNDRQEEALAMDPAWQEFIAKTMFEGIKQYFGVLKNI